MSGATFLGRATKTSRQGVGDQNNLVGICQQNLSIAAWTADLDFGISTNLEQQLVAIGTADFSQNKAARIGQHQNSLEMNTLSALL